MQPNNYQQYPGQPQYPQTSPSGHYPPTQDYPAYVPPYSSPQQGYSSGGQPGYPPSQPGYPPASPTGHYPPASPTGHYPPTQEYPAYVPPYSSPQQGYSSGGQPGYPPAGQPSYSPTNPHSYPLGGQQYTQSPTYGSPIGQQGYPSGGQQGYSSGGQQGYFSGNPQVQVVKNRCTVNYCKAVGIGTGIFEKGSGPAFKGFPTYQMELHYIDEIFQGKTQHWNVKYDKAQQIFGTGITSSVLRKTITAQHAYLYRSTNAIEFYEIGNAQELLTLLESGRKGNLVVFYTYVIVNGCWRFTQTGPSTFKDFFSKHACHANCSETVTYSGEFHFQNCKERGMKLIIDNNSGTFGPDKNDLPKVAELFRRNFPGLEVEALDYADPILKDYIVRAKAHNENVTKGLSLINPY